LFQTARALLDLREMASGKWRAYSLGGILASAVVLYALGASWQLLGALELSDSA